MNITGDRNFIWIEFDNRTVKISGELTTTPAFYAEINSMNYWEAPFENVKITEKEKDEIIKSVIEDTKDKPFKIYFE